MNRKGLLLPLVLIPLLTAAGCHADGDGKHGDYKRPKRLAVSTDAPKAWREECSACHLAYPPGLLPADAWRKQMQDLSNHYGSDASLDPETERVILDYLIQASTGNRLPSEGGKSGNPPRITETRWFLKKHDDISASTFSRPSIGSAANCVTCHRDAEKGDFDEDRVNIPKASRQSTQASSVAGQAPSVEYALPRPSAAKGSGAGNSCKVTTITSSIDCGTSLDASKEPAAVIVWTQAADGTWTCVFSGASDTGLAPENCSVQEPRQALRQESLILPGAKRSTW